MTIPNRQRFHRVPYPKEPPWKHCIAMDHGSSKETKIRINKICVEFKSCIAQTNRHLLWLRKFYYNFPPSNIVPKSMDDECIHSIELFPAVIILIRYGIRLHDFVIIRILNSSPTIDICWQIHRFHFCVGQRRTYISNSRCGWGHLIDCANQLHYTYL